MQIIYNGLDINDGINYFVESQTHEVSPPSEKNLQKIARSDDSVLLRKGFGIKTITTNVLVQDTTVAALDARIDTLKKTIEAVGKNLDIDFAGSVRRYVCTGYVGNMERSPRYARVEINFEVYGAYGQDVSATTASYSGKTTSPYTDTITIGGTASAVPDITITINSFTGASTRTVKLQNVDTGDYIQLDRSDWSGGDVIVISSNTMTVNKNGTKIPYLGIMPLWNTGAVNWEYTDTFTARNVTIGFSYNKRYL